MKAKSLGLVAVLASHLLFGQGAQALMLSVEPPSQMVGVGGSVSVDVSVSGLSGLTIGAYDISIGFDASLLMPTGVMFGAGLGGPADSLQSSDLAYGPNLVNVAETSFLSTADLAALQGDPLTLFTLSFTGIGAGVSAVTLEDFLLVDGDGNEIGDYGTSGAEVQVEATGVPEPATLALLALGLAGLGYGRRQYS